MQSRTEIGYEFRRISRTCKYENKRFHKCPCVIYNQRPKTILYYSRPTVLVVISTDDNASGENNNNIPTSCSPAHVHARFTSFSHTHSLVHNNIYMCNLFKSTIGNESANDYSDHVRGTLCVSTAQRRNTSAKSPSLVVIVIIIIIIVVGVIAVAVEVVVVVDRRWGRKSAEANADVSYRQTDLTIIIYIIIKRRFRERVFFTAAVAYTYAARIREHTIITIMIIRPVRPAWYIYIYICIFSSYIRVITVIYCYRRGGGTAFAVQRHRETCPFCAFRAGRVRHVKRSD